MITPQLQRRTVSVLAAGQVLSGIGMGATLAMGAVIAAEMAGEALSGAAATGSTLGAAIASIPLARFALRSGRRAALTLGALIAAAGSTLTIVATGLGFFPLLVLSFAALGVGTAVGLQARFAATDIASDQHRGRDLSVVVWSTTVGAVVGPNLFGPGEAVAEALSLPEHTGSFVFAIAAQLLAALLYFATLRPDPLHLAQHRDRGAPADPGVVRSRALLVLAIGSIAAGHAVMVAVMSMTPVHLTGHGFSLTLVGLTISLHVAGMYALSPVFGWASDKAGRIPTILFGQAQLAASVLIVALGEHSEVAITIGLILLGTGWSAATVAGAALVTDLVTGAARLRVQGRTDTIMSLAGAAGGALAGPVLALIGYAGLAWVAGGFVLAVTAAVIVIGLRRRVPDAVVPDAAPGPSA